MEPQEVMDIMMTEKRLQIEHMRGLHHAIKRMWTGRKDVSSFWVAEHGPVRPHERSLEPLTGTDGCGTMMDNLVDDDAGETSAVRSQIQPVKPSDQEIATHEACGHCPYRDWYRACVGVTGRTLTNDGMKNKTVCLCEHGLWVLHRWGDDGEKTREPLRF